MKYYSDFRWIKPLGLLLLVFSLTIGEAYADNRQARKFIRHGNSQFRTNKRHEAQVDYFKAVSADSTDARAQYNLATSMFPENFKLVREEQRDTMVQTFMKAGELEQNPYRRSQAYHNMGVVLQGAKDFQKAIEAYKQALRNNPNDDEARYNLVLCQRQLKNDGNGGGGGQDNQQEDKQKQEEQQKQEQQQQQQQQEPPMSKENAEQLLNAAMQQEKQTQERMQQQQQGQRRRIEKNW
ncbi:MAG: tetratricopeptide repeat protein [Prevotella sp.]|nr:tetratricopeptide repeat protein [Prevotella sp.]